MRVSRVEESASHLMRNTNLPRADLGVPVDDPNSRSIKTCLRSTAFEPLNHCCRHTTCYLHAICMLSACYLHAICMLSACYLHAICMLSACYLLCLVMSQSLGRGHRLRVSHEAATASLRISTPAVGKSIASHRFTSLHHLMPYQFLSSK